jgi:hypothetical protein
VFPPARTDDKYFHSFKHFILVFISCQRQGQGISNSQFREHKKTSENLSRRARRGAENDALSPDCASFILLFQIFIIRSTRKRRLINYLKSLQKLYLHRFLNTKGFINTALFFSYWK